MIKKYLEKDENIIAKIICFILLVFVYNFCMGCSNQIEKNTENDKIGEDMEENIYLDKLARRDIKPTAIRLLILKNMMEVGRAVSLLDLETLLDTVDKSTISRTIALFLSHHLIHSIDDGSGSLKYAVCNNSCN